jgi:hypothetical protein
LNQKNEYNTAENASGNGNLRYAKSLNRAPISTTSRQEIMYHVRVSRVPNPRLDEDCFVSNGVLLFVARSSKEGEADGFWLRLLSVFLLEEEKEKVKQPCGTRTKNVHRDQHFGEVAMRSAEI